VTFDLDLDLEHTLDACLPDDHRVQVWWRSGHLSARRSDLRKNLQTDVRTDDGRRAIALAHSWNELKMPRALVSAGNGQLGVIVERVPVMFRRMTGIPAPFQVAASHITFHDILDHSPRDESVDSALEERQVEVERRLRSERVVEDCLLVGLAPAMSPVIVDPLHVHATLAQDTEVVDNPC